MLKRISAIEKEKKIIEREEEKRQRIALKESAPGIGDKIESKIPDKIYENLQKAFTKAFEIVFEKGVGIIEKTYDKDDLLKSYEINDFAVHKKGGRKEFKNLHKQAKTSGGINMLLSTIEGSLLGVLGIGMPDIIVFTGMLLKGTYELSLHYGYDYDSQAERFLILQLMEASLTKGEAYIEMNERINQILANDSLLSPTAQEWDEQMKRTANAMAADMLVMKFMQGLPLVGIIGGVMNPVYYQKITGYMRMKYHRRYVMKISIPETRE